MTIKFNSCLATHEWALHQTQKVDGFVEDNKELEDLIWGAAATAGTMSMPHVDDAGLATCVTTMTGSKWWVLLQQRDDLENNDHRGDLLSTHAFPLNWEHTSTGRGFFQAEGLHFKAGDNCKYAYSSIILLM